MALSKKGPTGYKHSLSKANSPNKVVTASRISPASSQGGDGPSLMVPLTGCLVLQDPLGNGCPGALAPDHPRTAGSQDSPRRGPRPWVSNQGWLREKCRVLPQHPRSHSTPPSPNEDIIRGALFGASAPENWCQSVVPLKMSICTPGQCKLP